jgi:hypothetical protein
MYGAVEAGRGPGKNDKPVSVACQPLADVNLFILIDLTQSGTFFLSLFVFALRARKPGALWAHRKKGSTMLPQAKSSLKRPARNSCG